MSATPAADPEGVEAGGPHLGALPEEVAEAGLRYSSDAEPGVTRRRAGRGFSYRDATGVPIHDPKALARFRSLAIPPAWTDVWISPDPDGHLQATGRDAKGRKQYRYHPQWRANREEDKFTRMVAFAEALPRIRARVDADLARPGLERDKVLAAVVRLLELTLIRVGNDEYARLNRSFGLSTLRNRHAAVEGTRVRFRFTGKHGRRHEVGIRDRRLAAIVRRCRELPGQELFEYVEADGTVRDVRSDDVNAYIREASGGTFSAKDFRTWAGTVLAFRALRSLGEPARPADLKKGVVVAVKEAAERLGNTPAVAKASYVHPAVVDAYLDDELREFLLRAVDVAPEAAAPPQPEEERAVLDLLRRRLGGRRRRSRRTAEPDRVAARTRAPSRGRAACKATDTRATVRRARTPANGG